MARCRALALPDPSVAAGLPAPITRSMAKSKRIRPPAISKACSEMPMAMMMIWPAAIKKASTAIAISDVKPAIRRCRPIAIRGHRNEYWQHGDGVDNDPDRQEVEEEVAEPPHAAPAPLLVLTDIRRRTGLLNRDCCRTTAFARASPRQECRHA